MNISEESKNSLKQDFLSASATDDNELIHIVDNFNNSREFLEEVCIPYFKDIFKDLVTKSDCPSKGISKCILLDYVTLPGIIGERFFKLLDDDEDGYLNELEFIEGLVRFYFSDFQDKSKFIFDLYDFDDDGKISKKDIVLILSHAPLTKIRDAIKSQSESFEGKVASTGLHSLEFYDRIESKEQIENCVEFCLKDQKTIGFKEFMDINQNISSDMLLCILCLLKMELPSADQFKFYIQNSKISDTLSKPVENKSPGIASPKILSKFSPVSELIAHANSPKTNNINSPYIQPFSTPTQNSNTSLYHEFTKSNDPSLKNPFFKRMPNRTTALNSNTTDTNPKEGYDYISSPTTFLTQTGNKVALCKCGRAMSFNNMECMDCSETSKVSKFEGYLYIKVNSKSLKRFWQEQNNQ